MERERSLQREGFTEEEADAIVRRAVELQQKAGPDTRIPRETLEQSAEVAGVAPEFVQRAIAELRARQATATQGVAVRPRVRWQLALLAALIAMGISLLLSLRLARSVTPVPARQPWAPVAVPSEPSPTPTPVAPREVPPPRR